MKKNQYVQPRVEQTHMMPSSMVMAGSGPAGQNGINGGGNTGDISGDDPIPGD